MMDYEIECEGIAASKEMSIPIHSQFNISIKEAMKELLLQLWNENLLSLQL